MRHLFRGAVVDVDLEPTRGSETGKVRPAVVVTNEEYNQRVPVIQVVPLTAWSEQKARITTNVTVEPSGGTGLDKRSVADCLQTRPIDWRQRMRRVRGSLDPETLERIDEALLVVFGLDERVR